MRPLHHRSGRPLARGEGSRPAEPMICAFLLIADHSKRRVCCHGLEKPRAHYAPAVSHTLTFPLRLILIFNRFCKNFFELFKLLKIPKFAVRLLSNSLNSNAESRDAKSPCLFSFLEKSKIQMRLSVDALILTA
jgi:hypothetical protein